MIRRIVEHNRLNGVVFSTIEFLLVGAAAIFIGVAFGLHHRWFGAILAAGTAVNALVVVTFALAALRRGERDNSLRSLTRATYREELRREHPTMMRDTLALTGAVLAPYVLVVAVAVERGRDQAKT